MVAKCPPQFVFTLFSIGFEMVPKMVRVWSPSVPHDVTNCFQEDFKWFASSSQIVPKWLPRSCHALRIWFPSCPRDLLKWCSRSPQMVSKWSLGWLLMCVSGCVSRQFQWNVKNPFHNHFGMLKKRFPTFVLTCREMLPDTHFGCPRALTAVCELGLPFARKHKCLTTTKANVGAHFLTNGRECRESFYTTFWQWKKRFPTVVVLCQEMFPDAHFGCPCAVTGVWRQKHADANTCLRGNGAQLAKLICEQCCGDCIRWSLPTS